jgi:hypothetical protein
MKALESGGSRIFFTNCDFSGCQGPAKSKVEDTVSGPKPPKHVYSEYRGLDHGLWYSAYSQYGGMVDWLFSFRKQEGPTSISPRHRGLGKGLGDGYRKGGLRFDPAGRKLPAS